MRQVFGFVFLINFLFPSQIYGSMELSFNEYMAAFMKHDLTLQSTQEREQLWTQSQQSIAPGWDRSLQVDWKRRELWTNDENTTFVGRFVQETPYGLTGNLQYQQDDISTSHQLATVGFDVDLLRNRFGHETKQKQELLTLKSRIFKLDTVESRLRTCVNGLDRVSRFILLKRQEEIYQHMLSLRQDLYRFLQKRVQQGAIGQEDLLTVETEIIALKREAQVVQQARIEWNVVEVRRLSRNFKGLHIPNHQDFLRFQFIGTQNEPRLPELARLEQEIEESQARRRFMEHQSLARLTLFGRTTRYPLGQSELQQEYGLSLTLPLQDFDSKQFIIDQQIEIKRLESNRLIAHQKAEFLLAEIETRIAALNQRLEQSEKAMTVHQRLHPILSDQYQKGAVDLIRVIRQQEMRLREEMELEQILHELRSTRSLYVLMAKNSPNFCLGA